MLPLKDKYPIFTLQYYREYYTNPKRTELEDEKYFEPEKDFKSFYSRLP